MDFIVWASMAINRGGTYPNLKSVDTSERKGGESLLRLALKWRHWALKSSGCSRWRFFSLFNSLIQYIPTAASAPSSPPHLHPLPSPFSPLLLRFPSGKSRLPRYINWTRYIAKTRVCGDSRRCHRRRRRSWRRGRGKWRWLGFRV